jgi:hypothetical protein
MRSITVWLAVGMLGCSSQADLGGEVPDAAHAVEVDAAAAVVPGDPIVVPPDQMDQWVWIPIPEMRCADDTPAGVGVRFTDASRNLVIWFQGNGVCYDLKSCTMFRDLLVGMGDDPLNHLWWGDPAQGDRGIFDRNAPDNPFRDDNFVVLPHCGVDGHTADKESSYLGLPTYQQRGYRNVTEALARIVPTFPDADRVVVAGFSAGGIGATANYHQIASALEGIGQPSPFLIADAGPLLRDPYLSAVAVTDLRAGWGLDDTIVPWCPECGAQAAPSLVYQRLAELHPGMRSSIICAYQDGIVTNLYRLLNYDLNVLDNDKLHRGLVDLHETLTAAMPGHRDFFYASDRHGALVLPYGDTPGLLPFLTAQLDGDPDWASVVP